MPRLLDNWLLAYEEYTRGTESPDSFHLWVGLATIAAAAQRKIYLRMGHMTVHSNMFVVLVGPSGGPRKSTALNIGRDLVFKTSEYGIKLHLAPKKASAAALISRMALIKDAPHQSITAYASELGTLLGASSVEISDILTDLWDCDPNFDKDTVSRGAEKITAPWINVVAATTPTWLAENLPKTAAEGGFVSRGLYVYEDRKPRRVAIPQLTTQQEETGLRLVHDLAEIARLAGEFTFSDSARKCYEDWYEDPTNFRPKHGNRMETYYERKHVHVLKAAMLMSLAEDDSLLLEPMDIEAAIDLVERVEVSMSFAFQGVGKNPLSMDQERIQRSITAAGAAGLPYKQLLAAHIHSLDKSQIDAIIMTLREMGVIAFQENKLYDLKQKSGALN